MDIDEGFLFRHPAWGPCRVTEMRGDRAEVLLESGEYKVVTLAFARAKCTPLRPTELRSDSRLLRKARSPTHGDAPVALQNDIDRSRPCASCREPLNHSLADKGGNWKSCPNCSALNVRENEHVFHRFPAAFGTSVKRISAETPDGRQSWCTSCRLRDQPQYGMLRGDRHR
jgi:hypothetical protein